jgi:Protein of unknown function (DUF2695)
MVSNRDYISRNGMDEELIIQWLETYGGYCDCEVLKPALRRLCLVTSRSAARSAPRAETL